MATRHEVDGHIEDAVPHGGDEVELTNHEIAKLLPVPGRLRRLATTYQDGYGCPSYRAFVYYREEAATPLNEPFNTWIGLLRQFRGTVLLVPARQAPEAPPEE